MKNKELMPKLKTVVTVILTTAVVISGVWAFFFARTMALKDEQMELLKEQNNQLRQDGAVPEAVKDLEKRLIPLTLAFAIDPLNGRLKVGSAQENPTEITMLIIKAEELRKEKKFDLASEKLDEIINHHPTFRGTPYFRFLIEKDKGNAQEALTLAEEAIEYLSEDERILPAYAFAIEENLKNGQKKVAEDLCLDAIRLDPKNESFRSFFKENFNYEPSIPTE